MQAREPFTRPAIKSIYNPTTGHTIMSTITFSSTGNDLCFRATFRKLSIRDRQSLLLALLKDNDTCPGQSEYNRDELATFYTDIDKRMGNT